VPAGNADAIQMLTADTSVNFQEFLWQSLSFTDVLSMYADQTQTQGVF